MNPTYHPSHSLTNHTLVAERPLTTCGTRGQEIPTPIPHSKKKKKNLEIPLLVRNFYIWPWPCRFEIQAHVYFEICMHHLSGPSHLLPRDHVLVHVV